MNGEHIKVDKLSYCKDIKKWLIERYGLNEADKIWEQVVRNYKEMILTIWLA